MQSGPQLRRLIQQGTISYDGDIRGHGLLVSLGKTIQDVQSGDEVILPWKTNSVRQLYSPAQTDWDTFDIRSGEYVLSTTAERLALPESLCGVLRPLGDVSILGLSVDSVDPFINPLRSGSIPLKILNLSKRTIRLRQGMAVATIHLFSAQEDTALISNSKASVFFNQNLFPDPDPYSRHFSELLRGALE